MTDPAQSQAQLLGKQAVQNVGPQGAKKGVRLDADRLTLQRTAGNNAVYNLIDPADRFSAKASYAFGNRNSANSGQIAPGTTGDKQPAENLGELDEIVINTVAAAVAQGNFFEHRLVAAAMRGFISEMDMQLIDQNKAQRVQERLAELRHPAALAAFVGSYAAGFAAGMVSPVTQLFGLPAFADAVQGAGR